ncbi:MAG: TonB-dependent receptor [Rhodospirillaceae bacterium]|nr:TonB-dependent receptor [Rhodospirillaceae bacterium]
MAHSASRSLIALCLVTTSLVGVATEASAQQIEEIIVTTRKRAESLQEVPIVIQAFTAEVMERKGIASLEDVTKYTPGISLEEGFSKQDTRITIRGLSPTRGRQNAAVLIDDVDISSEAIASAGGSMFINPRLFDTERVEVVKGPHSALYGRSAFAGAINYITKKPGNDVMLNASADVGTYGKAEGRVSASGPVIEDKLAIGGAVALWNEGGFYRNSITGKRVGGGDGQGVSGGVTFTPTEQLKFYLRGEYSDDHFDPEARTFVSPTLNTLTVPASAIAPAGTTPIPGITSTTTTTSAVLGKIPDAARLPVVRLSRNPRTGQDYPGDDRTVKALSLRSEGDFSAVSLISMSYYGDSKSTQFHDTLGAGDATVVNAIQETHFVTTNKLLSQDLRLQSADEADSPISWSLGGLFWNEVTRQIGRSNACVSTIGGCNTILSTLGVTRPYFAPSNAAFGPVQNEYNRDTHNYSVYGIAEYKVTEEFRLSVEARHTWEVEKIAATINSTLIGCTGGQRTLNTTTGVLSCTVPAPQGQSPTVTIFNNGGVLSSLAGTKTNSEFTTPRFTAEYKFDPAVMVYASAGKGQKPGGVLSLLAATPIVVSGVTTGGDYTNTKFLEERLWVYELGMKAEWLDGKVRTNMDVYRQDFKYKQESGTRIDAQGLPIPGPANAEKARSQGFEFDGTAALTDQFSVSAGYTRIDAKYKNFKAQQSTAPNIALAGNCTFTRPPTGNPYCVVDYSGKSLVLSPKHSFNLSGEFRTEVFPDTDLFLDLDTRYMGKRFTTFDNNTILNSYFVADARIGLSAKHWQIIAYMNNLSNNDALKSGGVALPDFTSGFISPVSPGLPSGFLANLPDKRQVGLRVSYTY